LCTGQSETANRHKSFNKSVYGCVIMATMRKPARMPTGYVRDRTKVYKEKWEALHPNRGYDGP